MGERKMLREGIIREGSEGTYLVGKRCKKCGDISFPGSGICTCCLSDEFEEIPLSTKGKLYSFTTTMMPVRKLTPPHSIGYIDLPEHVRIFAPLVKEPGVEFKVGMDMELEIGELWKEDDDSIVCFKFRPCSE